MGFPFLQNKNRFFWHVTLTGKNGELFQSIMQRGILPKNEITSSIGNERTINTEDAYASVNATQALDYLKSATNLHWEYGGLPLLIAIKAEEFTKDYTHDDDISRGLHVHDGKSNITAWVCLISAYGSIESFIKYCPQPSKSCKDLKEFLQAQGPAQGLNLNTQVQTDKLFDFLTSKPFRGLFFEGYRLGKFKEQVTDVVWKRFLTNLTSMGVKTGLHKNISKKDGWKPEQFARVYVLSPNGEQEWLKWAKVMPPNKAAILAWEKWHELEYAQGNFLPGNGKLVRLK